jgi:hypothetical protein
MCCLEVVLVASVIAFDVNEMLLDLGALVRRLRCCGNGFS